MKAEELMPEEPCRFETHVITPDVRPMDTVTWLMRRGYRAVAARYPGVQGGLVFGRKNEPAYVAVLGDTLIWNGENVVIE